MEHSSVRTRRYQCRAKFKLTVGQSAILLSRSTSRITRRMGKTGQYIFVLDAEGGWIFGLRSLDVAYLPGTWHKSAAGIRTPPNTGGINQNILCLEPARWQTNLIGKVRLEKQDTFQQRDIRDTYRYKPDLRHDVLTYTAQNLIPNPVIFMEEEPQFETALTTGATHMRGHMTVSSNAIANGDAAPPSSPPPCKVRVVENGEKGAGYSRRIHRKPYLLGFWRDSGVRASSLDNVRGTQTEDVQSMIAWCQTKDIVERILLILTTTRLEKRRKPAR
ncbi:hypothetical protein BD410DRAFT_808929 [Rickenella mellea]|uniref:Uncharacterized protein n=1 Tax=Rickenella mellea TaxID=50990 RepID=A0A4Y7PLG0_9AGAM|nr:hypothetical protein BD410DRAFT_808929 [Rickenella mellea]